MKTKQSFLLTFPRGVNFKSDAKARQDAIDIIISLFDWSRTALIVERANEQRRSNGGLVVAWLLSKALVVD